MIKKLARKAAFLALGLIVAIETVAPAQFLFVTNNGAITITGYSGAGGEVVIPPTTNGLPITSVGDYAFWFAQGISSINIPGSVTNLGQGAFGNCWGATNITIGNGVMVLGQSAFYMCVNLRQLVIPNTVLSIGDYAFRRCSSLTNVTIGSSVRSIGSFAFADSALTSVTIPASVTNIGSSAFFDALSLNTIEVEPLNHVYSSLNGVLFDAAGTTLLLCPPGRTGSYATPAGVVTIADSAFSWCTGLTNITMGAGLITIGNGAFYRSGVATAVMPQGVTSIGDSAFYWCSGLTSITTPGSVTNIGNQAFYNCVNLANVMLGTNLGNIGQSAFAGCFNLSSLTLPESVTSIGAGAFASCNISTIMLPANVTNIGIRALTASALTNISVDPLNPAYSSVDGVLFNKDQSILIQYPLARAGAYMVPAGTTTILSYAFHICPGLTNITMPVSLTNIGSQALSSCTKLVSIVFQGNAPSLGASALPSTNAILYYLPGTTNWTSPFGGRPAVLWNPSIDIARASFGMQTNRFGFDIVGTANIPLAVQACTNLVSPAWTTLKICTLTNGSIHFTDSASVSFLLRFYRIHPP